MVPEAPPPHETEFDEASRVCPSCRQPLAAFHELAPISGTVPRCPEHGLAFVDAYELSASDGDPLLGTTVDGRFTILARLGRGSMASVYRARQEAVGRDVALKIVRRERAYDADTKLRFEREARAISSLTSPHTVTAFDFGEAEDGSWFLAMEMLDGETVGDRLRRERRIEWPDAVRFARDALKSLAEAHGKGIIHRDLKPDNLFLVRLPEASARRQELCKVLDFGIAKWQSKNDAPIDQLETQAGTVFGTPRYMSPEQAQGNVLDARSDLYSLGVMLYQMLTGRAPFIDDDAVVVMARHIKDEPPSFAEAAPQAKIPYTLERAVFRALEKNPALRPQSAEAMALLLEQAVEQARASESGVQSTRTPETAPRPWLAQRSLAIALLCAALAVALVAIYGLVRRTPAPQAALASAPAVVPPPVARAPMSAEPLQTPPAESAATDEHTPHPLEISSATQPSPSAPSEHALRAHPKDQHSKRTQSTSLPRKGNERYGRFE